MSIGEAMLKATIAFDPALVAVDLSG